MTSARIAFRNIARQKKRSALLGGAIAFGVLAIVLMGSFAAGLLASVRGNVAGIFGGHIYVRGEEISATGRRLSRIGDRQALEAALAAVGADVAESHFRSRARGDLIFGSRQESIMVEGIDWQAEATLWRDLGITGDGQAALAVPDGVILPQSVAASLGVQVGESLLLRLGTISGQANVGDFEVVAVYAEAQGLGAAAGYASLPYLNSLLGLAPGEYQSLNIAVRRMEDMDAVASALHQALARVAEVEPRDSKGQDTASSHRRLMSAVMTGFGSSLAAGDKRWEGTRFAVTTLNDVLSPILSLVRTLVMIRMALFAVLLLIIMVGLLNSFRMVLIERTQEIGTLRALGMQRGGVRSLFVLEALFLALAGALSGLTAALLVMGGLGAVRAPATFRVFTTQGHFAFPIVPNDLLTTLFALAACTLLAAWLPAAAAARLRPADALRAAA